MHYPDRVCKVYNRLYLRKNDRAAATDSFRKAKGISGRLVARDPTNAQWKRDADFIDSILSRLGAIE